MEQGRMRQGRGAYLFEMDGTKAIPKAYNILDMKDEELGDFLGEEERTALAVARQQRKESAGRDMCKEAQEAKEQEQEALRKRNKVLEQWAREQEAKQKKTEERIEKLASLVAQLMGK